MKVEEKMIEVEEIVETATIEEVTAETVKTEIEEIIEIAKTGEEIKTEIRKNAITEETTATQGTTGIETTETETTKRVLINIIHIFLFNKFTKNILTIFFYDCDFFL